MKKICRAIQAMSVVASVFFCMCSSSPIAGGNSSQTGNAGIAVASRSLSILGATVPNAHVSIYEQNYSPYLTPSGYCDSTVADDSGRFSFSTVQEGVFNLLVCDVHRGNAGFISRIPVFADSVFTDTIDTLKQPGFISGTAMDTAGTIYALSYIFIDGSPFYTVTRNNGDFLLGPLPKGIYATGLFANFQVSTVRPGELVQMADAKTDTTVVTVFPDSVSTWKW
jgi:hypothetical protein